MDDESENSSNSSNRIEELIVDLGNERFMTRNDAIQKYIKQVGNHVPVWNRLEEKKP